MALKPVVNYPAAQIQKSSGTAQLSTGASTVILAPFTSAGFKPGFLRIAISNGSVYMRTGADTSTTAVTSDTIINSNEALWINALGVGAVALRQVAPGGVCFATVSACEEGGIRPPSDTSGLG